MILGLGAHLTASRPLHPAPGALKPPTKTESGGYSPDWADPDGQVWEYAFAPFWPLDEQGRLTPLILC